MLASLKETPYEAGRDGRTAEPPINWQAVNCVTLFSNASGNELLVLSMIARFVKAEGEGQGTAYPSVQTLEALTRLSRRTVQRCLQRLEEAGELLIKYRAGGYETNLYTIPMLQAGGVRTTHELPNYISVITEERRPYIQKKGSYSVKVTPQTVAREIRMISLKFADTLIAAGRKHPGYRADAESRDWRYGVEKLVIRMGFPLDHDFIGRLFEYLAVSEDWKGIQTPRDIHDNYYEIVAAMKGAGVPLWAAARVAEQDPRRDRGVSEAGTSPPQTESDVPSEVPADPRKLRRGPRLGDPPGRGEALCCGSTRASVRQPGGGFAMRNSEARHEAVMQAEDLDGRVTTRVQSESGTGGQ